MTSPTSAISPTRELIRKLLAQGLKQTEISQKTGIPQPRISRWFNGEVSAGADDALKLQALVNDYEKQAKGRRSTDLRKA